MKRWPRLLRILPILALVAVALPAPEAGAYHNGIHLEVTPEVQRSPVGTPTLLTAMLMWNQERGGVTVAGDKVTVHFENLDGAGDHDGDSPTSPDYSCIVQIGDSTCSIEIQGTRTGTALIKAWINSDGIVSSDESDPDEGRFANLDDCEQVQDSRSDCMVDPENPENAPKPGSMCKTSMAIGTVPQPPGSEPDCTDVVEIEFQESAAEVLDCDDASGPDTEHEWNPHGNGDSPVDPSSEIYTCIVHDQFGNRKPGAQVTGRTLAGPDGLTTQSNCTTAANDDLTTTDKNEKGTCEIKVAQTATSPQRGLATICFWVGSLTGVTDLCKEAPDAGANDDGSDTGDNRADVVELVWENVGDLTLDCTPEDGISLVGRLGSVECTALSRASKDPVGGITVRAEASGENDPDDSNSPETQDAQREDEKLIELKCVTDSNGRCTIPHRGVDPGETIYRAWIDDGEPEPSAADNRIDTDLDQTEKRDEKLQPGSMDEPDATDVVVTAWGQGPASVAMSPQRETASLGQCHEVTIRVTDKDGSPAGGVPVDVEQKHELAANSTPKDEPIVAFCDPVAGPNPSAVDTSLGDLDSSGDGPNTTGKAGGETTGSTDENGEITIGVTAESANGSNGSGTVYLTTWWEEFDNDDPGGGDPMDSGSVTWSVDTTENAATLDLTPDVAANDPGSETTFTATVTQNGNPVPGVQIAWSASGEGTFTWNEATTDTAGQAIATVTSEEAGSMTVTATCMGSYKCTDTSTQNWGPSMCDIVGTDGDDTLTGTEAPETICGLGGDDTIDGGGGDDTILGDVGNDTISGGAGSDEIYGDAGADVIKGGSEDDVIFGSGGKDTIKGGGGNDVVYGDGGSDQLFGNGGDDRVYGGAGRDALSGNAGADALFGGAKADHLNGGKDNDLMVGGGGKDTFKGTKSDHCYQASQSSKRVSCG